jgi:hypothetical protein
MTKSYDNIPDGCNLHKTCATCPFPDCRADTKQIKKESTKDEKHKKVLLLHSQNIPVKIIQQRIGYKDTGCIYRIIREGC